MYEWGEEPSTMWRDETSHHAPKPMFNLLFITKKLKDDTMMTYYAIPGQAIVGSSIIILTTNLLMMFLSMTKLPQNSIFMNRAIILLDYYFKD